MPIDLVLVRHGESEINLANRASRRGDESLWTPEFRARHASEAQLTTTGRDQARAAGPWIQQNIGTHFDRYYVSPYVRAMETAGLLGLPDASWFIHHSLRERDWGDLELIPTAERDSRYAESMLRREINPLYWRPPNGESIVELAERLYAQLLGTFHRELNSKRVVIVCHGETMWGFRYMLERMSEQRWIDLDRSRDPADHINNCQVLQYTRRDPASGQIHERLSWMRSVWPYDPTRSRPDWQQLVRPRYSNDELLAMVAARAPMIPN